METADKLDRVLSTEYKRKEALEHWVSERLANLPVGSSTRLGETGYAGLSRRSICCLFSSSKGSTMRAKVLRVLCESVGGESPQEGEVVRPRLAVSIGPFKAGQIVDGMYLNQEVDTLTVFDNGEQWEFPISLVNTDAHQNEIAFVHVGPGVHVGPYIKAGE